MFGFRVPYIPGVPLWAYILMVLVIMAVPVAFFAKWKGYNFWGFLIAGALFNPLACLILVLTLPKIVRYVTGDEVEELPVT